MGAPAKEKAPVISQTCGLLAKLAAAAGALEPKAAISRFEAKD